jgi:hypothetical protein
MNHLFTTTGLHTMRKFFLSVACAVLLAPAALAETLAFEVTVAAEKHDRTNEPVRAEFSVSEKLANAQATLKTMDGKDISCQVTAPSLDARQISLPPGNVARELHFILPSLKAGETAKFKCVVDTDVKKPTRGFSWHDTKGEFTELRFDDKPVLSFVYKALDDSSKEKRDATFKVFHHLYDLEGNRVTRGEPTGLYPHHRGIFYGFNKVTYDDNKHVDIWHCTGETYQSGDKILSEEAGPVLGRHRVQIGWHGVKKELFATEERELTVYNVPGGRLVEFTSKLTPVKGTVHLDGDPQHAGFHFRAAEDVADKAAQEETFFIRPDGVGGKGKANTRNWAENAKAEADKKHVNLPWNAMCFLIGKQRYTLAYLDKPTNPKEARFSEREYGRIGSYFVKDVTAEKPLTVNYRLWLQKGEMKVAEVAALDTDFVEPAKLSVK